jgi:hypothetical protein
MCSKTARKLMSGLMIVILALLGFSTSLHSLLIRANLYYPGDRTCGQASSRVLLTGVEEQFETFVTKHLDISHYMSIRQWISVPDLLLYFSG